MREFDSEWRTLSEIFVAASELKQMRSVPSAASSGVIMPLGSVHLSQRCCGETKGLLMMTI